MKRLIALLLLALPILAGAQTTTPPIKVFGIPLGITVGEFRTKVEAVNEKLPALLGEYKADIILHMYESYGSDDIVWQVTIRTESKYGMAVTAGYKITSILSAKYGAPKESYNTKTPCLRWDLKNGYIITWYNDSSFYAQFIDYSALKKAHPELYKGL